MTPDSIYFELKQRNQRRFLFVVTAFFLAFFGAALIHMGVEESENSVLIRGQREFSGYANPYLFAVGYGLLSMILVHFFWVLRREQRVSWQRFAIGVHLAVALTSVATQWVFFNSTWMHETFRNINGYSPRASSPPSTELFLLPAFIILTFIVHALSWIYHEWLTRRLTHRERMEKRKREEWTLASTSMLGDDGELLYPIEMMSSEKRLR